MKTAITFLLSICIFLIPLELWGQLGQYSVIGDNVNIRSGPGTNHKILTTIKKGESVSVLSLYDANWAEVSYDYFTGYINRRYIVFSNQTSGNTNVIREKQNNPVGSGMTDIGRFWLFFISASVLYILSIQLIETKPVLSIITNLLSAGTVFLWTESCTKCFWFLNWDNQNIILWFVYLVLTSMFFGIIAGTALSNLKEITNHFDNILPNVIFLFVGLAWGLVLFKLISVMFYEHPLLFFFALIGAIPSSRTPTIYVAGEGHVTGHGHSGGGEFTGDNGHEYWYDGDQWHRY